MPKPINIKKAPHTPYLASNIVVLPIKKSACAEITDDQEKNSFSFFCKTDFSMIISDSPGTSFDMQHNYICSKLLFFNSNEFSLFISESNFGTAEIGQTLILVKQALLEHTLINNQRF